MTLMICLNLVLSVRHAQTFAYHEDYHSLRCSCISNSLINQAFACCDHGTLVPQPS